MEGLAEAPWVPLFRRIDRDGAVPVLAVTTPEALFVALASWLDQADHGDEAQALAQSIVDLWERLHPGPRPALN